MCSSIERGSWFILKKVTRQQFYGMLTGSVIFDSVETDIRLILMGKVTNFFCNEQILKQKNDVLYSNFD